MVEYALIIAGSSVQSFASIISGWLADINWTMVGYVGMGLVALRIAFWAFAPRNRY